MWVEKLGCNTPFVTKSNLKEIVPAVDVVHPTECTHDLKQYVHREPNKAPNRKTLSRYRTVLCHLAWTGPYFALKTASVHCSKDSICFQMLETFIWSIVTWVHPTMSPNRIFFSKSPVLLHPTGVLLDNSDSVTGKVTKNTELIDMFIKPHWDYFWFVRLSCFNVCQEMCAKKTFPTTLHYLYQSQFLMWLSELW